MRPTPAEEMAGAKRVLEVVVAPAVRDTFAAGQLKHVIEVMGRLAGEWDEALPALAAEVSELQALLAEFGRPADAQPPGGGFTAMNERHQLLRRALASVIEERDRGDDPAEQARLLAYLRAAAARWAPR